MQTTESRLAAVRAVSVDRLGFDPGVGSVLAMCGACGGAFAEPALSRCWRPERHAGATS